MINGLVHAAEQRLRNRNVVLQLFIQIVSGSSLHSNRCRGSSCSLAHSGNLRFGVALEMCNSSSVGSFQRMKCRILLLLSSVGSVTKALQGGSSGSSGSSSGRFLLLQMKLKGSRLLMHSSLETSQGDLRLIMCAPQVHLLLYLQVFKSICLLTCNSNSSSELLLHQVICFDQVSSALLLRLQLMIGMSHLLSDARLQVIYLLRSITCSLSG